MTRIAMVPGTFDPLTIGHEEIIRRAASLFDEVVVAVSVAERPTPCLTHAKRVACIENVFADDGRVRVCALEGLLVDCAKAQGASVIVRSVRHGSDLDYEMQMAQTNARLAPALETLFLLPSPASMGICASLVREIKAMGGDISTMVSPAVLAFLKGDQ